MEEYPIQQPLIEVAPKTCLKYKPIRITNASPEEVIGILKRVENGFVYAPVTNPVVPGHRILYNTEFETNDEYPLFCGFVSESYRVFPLSGTVKNVIEALTSAYMEEFTITGQIGLQTSLFIRKKEDEKNSSFADIAMKSVYLFDSYDRTLTHTVGIVGDSLTIRHTKGNESTYTERVLRFTDVIFYADSFNDLIDRIRKAEVRRVDLEYLLKKISVSPTAVCKSVFGGCDIGKDDLPIEVLWEEYKRYYGISMYKFFGFFERVLNNHISSTRRVNAQKEFFRTINRIVGRKPA